MRLRHNEHLFSCRPLIMLSVAIHSSLIYLSFICLRLWFSPFLPLSLSVSLYFSPSIPDRSISPWRRQWRRLTCLLKHAYDTFSPRSFSTRNSLKGILLVAAIHPPATHRRIYPLQRILGYSMAPTSEMCLTLICSELINSRDGVACNYFTPQF